MLNSVLIVGMPMVALLAAAFYIFTRVQRDMPYGHRTEDTGRSESWFSGVMTSRPRSTNPRQRRHIAANRGHKNDQTLSSESPDSGFADEEQCEICFENVDRVQLYPCRHSDICKACVHKLLLSNQRQCPFCRTRIDGYTEDGSSDLFMNRIA